MYLFRDSSAPNGAGSEIILKIGPREWMYFGSIGPNDTIEVTGDMCRKHWQPEIHAKMIRRL